EPLMHTLIVRTIVNRLQLRAKLRRRSAFFMCLKGRLVLPKFNNHEVVRPSDFLYDIYPRIPLLGTSRFAVLLDQRAAVVGGIQLDIDISSDIESVRLSHHH